jgi:hypothetical protein
MVKRNSYYNGEETSVNDSMIDTSECAIAYDNNYIFLQGIKSCIHFVKGYVGLYRYPEMGRTEDFSRDQLSKMIPALTLCNEVPLRDKVLKAMRFRLSLKFRLGVDLWLWKHALLKNSKFIGAIHHLIMFFVMSGSGLWNGLIFLFFGVRRVKDKDYVPHMSDDELTRGQRFARKRHLLYPAYAFDKFCWQLFIMPDSRVKRALGWWCNLILGDKENYVHRMLLGCKVTQEEVNSYHPYLHSRFSTWLLNINRTTEKMPEGKFSKNLKDVALLHKLYNITQCQTKTSG